MPLFPNQQRCVEMFDLFRPYCVIVHIVKNWRPHSSAIATCSRIRMGAPTSGSEGHHFRRFARWNGIPPVCPLWQRGMSECIPQISTRYSSHDPRLKHMMHLRLHSNLRLNLLALFKLSQRERLPQAATNLPSITGKSLVPLLVRKRRSPTV